MNKQWIIFAYLHAVLVCLMACSGTGAGKMAHITACSTDDKNALRASVHFDCTGPGTAYVAYWPDGADTAVSVTEAISLKGAAEAKGPATAKTGYRLVLTNLAFSRTYHYCLVWTNGKDTIRSAVYDFTTRHIPDGWAESYICSPDGNVPLPASFTNGSMLVYKRETPGFLALVDHLGQFRWYASTPGTGVKVAHFTAHQTLLAILAPMDYPTSYGNEILELSLTGDTLMHLKKGQKDFQQTIHHEILLNDKDQIVTLSARDSIFDLSKAGGHPKDTVRGDGILVLDRSGRKVWSWSVFDVLDPLQDKQIARIAKDWMHANSLFIDKEGNYLISFYNNGQIWKLNGVTGKIMWRFGRGGDFSIPTDDVFDQGHAVHINTLNELMLFDNGTSKGRSQIVSFHIDTLRRNAEPDWHVQLQSGTFTDRMGSAYLLDTGHVLACVAKQNTALLLDRKGAILWRMSCAHTPYRVEFIPFSLSLPFIGPDPIQERHP